MWPSDPVDLRLLDEWQHGFPLTSRPYAAIGERLGLSETAVLERLARLSAQGVIARVGAVLRPHVFGVSTLAALALPPARLEAVARFIDGFAEVNHNYEREHIYNLWFVLTAADEARLAAVLTEIARYAGAPLLDLPMLEDYHIDLGFALQSRAAQPRPHLAAAGRPAQARALRAQLTPPDHALVGALEGGLPLDPTPYARLAAASGMSEADCLTRLGRLIDLGAIRRLGIVVRHRELGFRANAMVVWDVPDAVVAEVGRRLATEPAVSLCYRRPRRPPHWPYNLFTMLHGRDRSEVLASLDELRARLQLADIPCEPLFSRRRFKQCGARYGQLARAA